VRFTDTEPIGNATESNPHSFGNYISNTEPGNADAKSNG
jgi:hypothetical protein